MIVDVIQHAPAHDGDGMKRAVSQRALGVAIAVDGCHDDAKTCAVIESLVELAAKLHSTVVADGIETDDDLVIVQSLGVRIVQGFLLALPMEGRTLRAWPGLSPSSAA